jgi:hypothetical protein
METKVDGQNHPPSRGAPQTPVCPPGRRSKIAALPEPLCRHLLRKLDSEERLLTVAYRGQPVGKTAPCADPRTDPNPGIAGARISAERSSSVVFIDRSPSFYFLLFSAPSLRSGSVSALNQRSRLGSMVSYSHIARTREAKRLPASIRRSVSAPVESGAGRWQCC